MIINWENEKTYEWFLSAAEYTGYPCKMAELLSKRLPKGGTLADIGCGMGLVDISLHPLFKSITCIDISEASLGWLETEIKKREIDNIIPLRADAKELSGTWDCAISLFHGQPEDFCGHYLSLVKEKLIMVTHPRPNPDSDPFKTAMRKNANVDSACRIFDKAGLDYKLTETGLEYGQPLKDEEDALLYIEKYRKNPPGMTYREYMAENVIETGRTDYPLYLPYLKKFGIFEITVS